MKDDPRQMEIPCFPGESMNIGIAGNVNVPCPQCGYVVRELQRRATWKTGEVIVMFRVKCTHPDCNYSTALLKDSQSALRAWRVASIVAK